MNRGVLLIIFIIALLSLITALTGETITGEVPQAPTNVSVFVLPGAPIIYIYSPENTTYYTTSILLNYSIKNNVNQAWYNLDGSNNISLGNLTDNSLTFTTTLGNHVLYLYANNTNGIRVANVSFTVSEQPQPPPSSSSGSGGGGGGGASVSSFDLDRDLIEASIFQGESKKEVIKITNTGNNPINITFELVDLEEKALIEEDFLFLQPKETKELNINLFSLSKTPPSLYIGKIILKAGSIQKSVHVIIEVKERNALFDVNLEILPQYKVVSSGKKISVLIDMTNIGFKGTPTDVELALFLMDLDKNIIQESFKETIAVKTNLSIVRKLEIPANVAEGKYIALADLRYNGFKASSYDTFDVIKEKMSFPGWYLLVLALIILLIIILLRTRKHEKSEKVKVKIKKIKKS